VLTPDDMSLIFGLKIARVQMPACFLLVIKYFRKRERHVLAHRSGIATSQTRHRGAVGSCGLGLENEIGAEEGKKRQILLLCVQAYPSTARLRRRTYSLVLVVGAWQHCELPS
jgi:hypothetical protein